MAQLLLDQRWLPGRQSEVTALDGLWHEGANRRMAYGMGRWRDATPYGTYQGTLGLKLKPLSW